MKKFKDMYQIPAELYGEDKDIMDYLYNKAEEYFSETPMWNLIITLYEYCYRDWNYYGLKHFKNAIDNLPIE